MSGFGKLLEKKIRVKIKTIASGREEAKDSGINNLIERLSLIDLAAAEELKKTYIDVVKKLDKK